MSTENFLWPHGHNSTPVSLTTNGTLRTKGIVVFSGGSAANNLVDVFKKVREDKRCPLSYVIPISDNGGSSSELIRVFGGPGIGDVRSRLVRLIPDDPDHDDSEKAAIKTFFNHRLPKERSSAREEWLQIVEAEHALWTNISTAKKELVRSILNVVAYEIVKRRRPSSNFDFSGASIGNLFLTGTIESKTPIFPAPSPTLRKQYITFSKADEEELPARIERLWYINPYGQEIRLSANPTVLSALNDAQAVIYSIGSLYTSIIPSLVLKGIGEAVGNPAIRYKILILNSTIDRETGPSSDPYSALDFIAAIAKACEESKNVFGPLDKSQYKKYVTHIIHLQGPGTPAVDRDELKSIGIEPIRVYGKKHEGENFVRYDGTALVQALEVTMGKRDPRMPSRRNTLEGPAR
ncbi:unnamed protein product [Alternaria alternata]